jgi:hypothetical protein
MQNLSDNVPIQNGPKQGDALSQLLIKFALEYAIGKVQENQVGLKLNDINFWQYTDGVNLVADNISTIKKNIKILIDANREVGLEINLDKSKYMLLSHHRVQVKIIT